MKKRGTLNTRTRVCSSLIGKREETKKALSIMIAILLGFANLGFAEGFSMRNGVEFGMTLEEIEKVETFSRDKSKNQEVYSYGYGKISGIDGSCVEYHFDQNGKLNSLEINFSEENKNNPMIKEDYVKINSLLEDKYGKPLGNKNGECYFLRGNEFNSVLSNYTLFKMLGTVIYDEWLLETEDGHIKIDHFCFYKGSEGMHCLEYSFFSHEDVKNMQNDL